MEHKDGHLPDRLKQLEEEEIMATIHRVYVYQLHQRHCNACEKANTELKIKKLALICKKVARPKILFFISVSGKLFHNPV